MTLTPTNPHNCGTCNRVSCDWYDQRDLRSRMNQHGEDRFSMRLATEFTGCERWKNHCAKEG